MADEHQPALVPIPDDLLPRTRSKEPQWSRWHGTKSSCGDCITERSGQNVPTTPLADALWRLEHRGRVFLLCSVHAARRGR